MNLLIKSLIQLCPEITTKEMEFMSKDLSISYFKKNDLYLTPNQIQKEIGYVTKGLIRVFYIDNKGKEITQAFVKENEYASDYLAFIKQTKTKYYFECIENCTIVNLPYNTIQNGYKTYKVFEKYGRLVAEKSLDIRINRIESFLFENAEERYLNFIKNNTNLINRISTTHLSSYLGIERQSLTRIKSKLAKLK